MNKEYLEYLDKIDKCKACSLRKLGQHQCSGIGNINSPIMFVGEAPGRVNNPDLRGLVFVGNRSSDLMLELIYNLWPKGYDDVYLTNVVKCNPPENREPTKEEIKVCSKWLEAEIRIVDPRLIVALGRKAANWFGVEESLSKARFKEYYWRTRRLYVRYHPAYILRFGTKMVEQYKGQFKLLRKEAEKYDEIEVKIKMPFGKYKAGETAIFFRKEVDALEELDVVKRTEGA